MISLLILALFILFLPPTLPKGSFIEGYQARKEFEAGCQALPHNWSVALAAFHRSLDLHPTLIAAEYVAWMLDLLGRKEEMDMVKTLYLRPSMSYSESEQLFNQGAALARQGENYAAIDYFIAGLDLNRVSAEGWFLLGASYHAVGQIVESVRCYQQASAVLSIHTTSMLNLATIYQQHGQLDLAIKFYMEIVTIARGSREMMEGYFFLQKDYVLASTNLAMAFYQLGWIDKALKLIQEIETELRSIQNSFPNAMPQSDGNSDNLIANTLDGLIGNRFLFQRCIARWMNREEDLQFLLQKTFRDAEKQHVEGPILPFDSLLYEISLEDKYKIAVSAARKVPIVPIARKYEAIPMQTSLTDEGHLRPLRVAFITIDVSNHPTSHLLEGLLYLIRRWEYCHTRQGQSGLPRVEYILFAYGKASNATFAQSVRGLIDEYYDLSSILSRSELVNKVYSYHIDILLDLQVFTLGGQPAILASHPNPILTMNYLVYPGTSGANFLDYIVGDKEVIPPEHAQWFSERLLLLPASYQPSYYGHFHYSPVLLSSSQQQQQKHSISGLHHGLLSSQELLKGSGINYSHEDNTNNISLVDLLETKKRLRVIYNLPSDGIILCNFNKIDKIDPTSFGIWMQIMQRLPQSYLWMLRPSAPSHSSNMSQETSLTEIVEKQMNKSLSSWGISTDRLLFAPWMQKHKHIERHLAADFFLDTIVYSAHSTATDALHGGLPLLTLRGDSFSNRVGSSLLASLTKSLNEADRTILESVLVVDSTKELEDTAVRLLNDYPNSPSIRIQRDLIQSLQQNIVSRLLDNETDNCRFGEDIRAARHFITAMAASKEAQAFAGGGPLPHLIILDDEAN
eukprot:gene772-837_t